MSRTKKPGLRHYRVICKVTTRLYVDIQGVLSRLDTCFDDKGEQYGIRNTRAEASSRYTLTGEKVEQKENAHVYQVYLTCDTEESTVGVIDGLEELIEEHGLEYGITELKVKSIK